MDIVVCDNFCSISRPRSNMPALMIIRDVCRARPKGYQFMKRYKSGHWDGYVSLMESISKFPTGLLPLVCDALKEHGYTVNLYRQDSIVIPPPDLSKLELNGIVLRDYQMKAIDDLIRAKRGIASMATGSGKTEVMAGIIKALYYPKTLIVLHLKDLLYQTAERIHERLNIPVGMIGDGVFSQERITVAMIQTLSNRIQDLELLGTDLLMIDECHHVSSDTMMDVLKYIPSSYRFGFSGTPLKYDLLSDMKLISITGDVVCNVTNEYMIEEGFSAVPTVNILTVEDYDRSIWKAKYDRAYKYMIVENKVRNKLIKKYALLSKGTVLILVSRIEHGKALNELIPGSVFVSGSDTIERRKDVLQSMRDGSGIFIASPIFDEGVDVPRIDTVIIAAGGKSRVKLLQRIGRGMRKKDGNNDLVIYDFIDDTNKYLLKHSQARIDTYVSEGFRTVVVGK